jgi:uncharacterized protein
MVRTTDPLVSRFATRYLPRLRRRYQPELVLVFGSRARGDALRASDLDLLVVSERFRGISFLDRASTVLTDLDLPFGADVLCYTPEEFGRKRRELGIVRQALKDGVPLHHHSPQSRAGRPQRRPARRPTRERVRP